MPFASKTRRRLVRRAAGLLGVDAGVERLASLQRHRVEIDLVGNGQEVRHCRIVEQRRSAEARPSSSGEAASKVRVLEPVAVRQPERPAGDAVD